MINFTQILFMMSIKASILILVILIVKFLFNRFFTAKTHYFIWFLLFISLTIPYAPKSNMSIYNIPKYFFYNASILNIQLSQNTFFPTTHIANTNGEKYYLENNQSTSKERNKPFIKTKGDKITTNRKSNILKFITSLYTSKALANIFAYIWLLGFLLLSFIVLIKTIHFHKLISSEQTLVNTEKIFLLYKCKSYLGIEKNLELIKTKNFSTPSLVGLFHPKILLPEQILSDFDDEKLEFILLHELAHLKRKDLFMNWIILIYQLIYWFNPIVWIGFYKMKNDMEVACDDFVLNHLEKEKHISYGKAIIALLEYFSHVRFIPISTNILENKSEVKRRIIMIKKFSKTSYSLTIISFLLIVLVGCSSISVPESTANPTEITEKTTQENPIKSNENSLSFSDAQKIFKNKKDILGKDYAYIWEIIGTPYVKTYYVNTKGLTKDEILKNLSSESIYPIESKEESSALYVFMENDKIVDVKMDEFSGVPSNTWKDSEYKVNAYSYQLGSDIDVKDLPDIEKDPDLTELKKEFLNKSLSDFKNKFNLSHGGNEAINKEGNLQLSVYPIISKDYAGSLGGIYVLSENNIIKNIKIDRPDIEFERLDEHFSSSIKNN
ncbi:hypothetical protein IZY60_12065 [Lutibacter sp. B2]|nr:hypothetical protein [Lutibacter sp. B2]